MLVLIDIFSINKSQGYENPILEIIVTACEHCFLNQSAFLLLFRILFLCIVKIMLDILLLFCHFQHFISVLHILYIWYLASGIIAFSLAEIVGICFRVETYSDVFKPQRSVVTRINPQLRDSYT